MGESGVTTLMVEFMSRIFDNKSNIQYHNQLYIYTREIPGVALVNCAISHIFTIIQIKLLKLSFFIHFSMHGCPIRLGPYLGGEGMYQKSENMWSFQMTPL